MAGMLNIGITGLNAAQAWLNTTSHNIANASTAGFSRQTIVQSTLTPVFSGSGFFGQGTQVDSVKRVYSQFLENQVLTADTRRASFAAYETQVTQIDNLLADPTAGLSPAIQSFFEGVQEVAANPSSVPARQALLASAESLSARFQQIDGRLRDIRDGVEGEIASTVSQINAHAKQLAEINQRILVAESAGTGTPANDLHDLRANVLRDLNQLVQVSTVTESDGSLSVFIGNGQPLVIRGQVTTLTTTPSTEDPQRLSIGLQLVGGGAVQMPESLITGGSLGGLLEFRRGALDTAQSQLGLIAVGISEAFNAQHRLGQDLDGALGLDFFKPLSPDVRPVSGATGTPTVAFGSVANLTGDSYRLTYTNTTGGYTLVNTRTNAAVSAAAVGLNITPPGTTVAGEAFIIEPTLQAAGNLRVALGDTRLVAAAAPVRTQVAANNAGTAAATGVTVTSVAGFAAGSPHIGTYTLQFNSGTNQYDVRDAGNTLIGSINFNPATDSAGVTRTLPGVLGGIDIKLSGVPANGDRITLESNTGGVADSGNAVALAALQTAKTMLAAGGGSATSSFQSTYSNLVSTIGNKTSEVKVSRAAQETLVGQASASREALSGVNLDEEAANLIRYQQAYQASARVMSIANSLFDEILSIAR